MNKNFNIVIIETSSIIFEGLGGIINNSGLKHQLSLANSLEDIELYYAKKQIDLVILNPSFVQNNVRIFNAIKCRYNSIKWIGIVHSYYDQSILTLFDAVINISDSMETINNTVQKILKDNLQKQNTLEDVLSDREIDVLKHLTTGLSNKEIADKLNISINTVITHRKNITQKTSIKSVSGLTIYAVVQKLISLDNIID